MNRFSSWYSEHIVEIAMIGLFIGVIFGAIILSKR